MARRGRERPRHWSGKCNHDARRFRVRSNGDERRTRGTRCPRGRARPDRRKHERHSTPRNIDEQPSPRHDRVGCPDLPRSFNAAGDGDNGGAATGNDSATGNNGGTGSDDDSPHRDDDGATGSDNRATGTDDGATGSDDRATSSDGRTPDSNASSASGSNAATGSHVRPPGGHARDVFRRTG